MTEIKPPLASESCHYYDTQGNPQYSVIGKNGNERPTTIRDARQHGYVPSVSTILQVLAKPGLNAWKEEQLLYAALTLPRTDGESLTDFSKRVREDAKAQAEKAAERGTALHGAIERYVTGEIDPEWRQHLEKLDKTLEQVGIDIHAGVPEHSFATSINDEWFGGKVDYHTRNGEPVLLDFKSKEKIETKKQLVWDEHIMQLGAYGFGLFRVISSGDRLWKWQVFRGLNVFVGISDCEIRVHEHPPGDLVRGFELFYCALEIWHRSHRFGKFSA